MKLSADKINTTAEDGEKSALSLSWKDKLNGVNISSNDVIHYQIYKRRRSNPGKSRFDQREEEQLPSPAGLLMQNDK